MTVEAQGRHERQEKVSRDDRALTGRRSAGRCCGKKGVAPRGGSAMLLPYGWQLAFTNSRSRELRHCVRPQSFLAVSTPLHCAFATEGWAIGRYRYCKQGAGPGRDKRQAHRSEVHTYEIHSIITFAYSHYTLKQK